MQPKQRLFVAEYLKDFNATEAYLRAGYKVSRSVARRNASDLLTNPDVQAAIREQQRAQEARTLITADRVLLELARVAFFDPRKLYDEQGELKTIPELDDDTAAAVASLEVEELFGKDRDGPAMLGRVKKVRMASKTTALKMLGDHFGLFALESDSHLVEMLVGLVLQHVTSYESRREILTAVERQLAGTVPRGLAAESSR